MAEPDWRFSLSSSLRFDKIFAIEKILESGGNSSNARDDAVSLEGEAYKTARSHAEYEAACNAVAPEDQDLETPTQPIIPARPESPGQVIGQYEKCHHIGEGITAQVFRSNNRALKVIVETRNIEPHHPIREARILETLTTDCIPLLETFRDREQRFVLVFPYMPLTLADLLDKGEELSHQQIRTIFLHVFRALEHIHGQGIIHRDIKPSAILLESPTGPAYLGDFGTAWHPTMSLVTEQPDGKVLDVGTGPYRAPEVLFGNKSYDSAVDMWGAGAMLAEACRRPKPRPLFNSPPTHEDGSQLGLILSIFQTIGSPTRETWPEAVNFKTPPFEMFRRFEHKPWICVLPAIEPDLLALVAALIRYDRSRATASQALQYKYLEG